jgi:hypothetical protein
MSDDQKKTRPDTPDHLAELADNNPEGGVPHLPHRHSSHPLPPEADKALASGDRKNGADAESSTSRVSNLSPLRGTIDENDSEITPQHPSTVRATAVTVMGLALLAGLAATWFHFNQGTYSLGGNSIAQVTPTPESNKPATLGAETNSSVTASMTADLPSLSRGHYQLWVTHDGKTASLGAFKPAANDSIQSLDGSAFNPTVTAAENDAVFVTIESGDGVAQSPSKTVILSGIINTDGQADMKFTAIDLSKAEGVYTLATPTSPDSNPLSGLWFAKSDGSKLTSPGLKLPVAPDGWAYEGQVVFKGVAVEIGRFKQADKGDNFSKFTPNPDKAPDFPGQDFLQKAPGQLGMDFPIDLTTGEWSVVISLEPDQGGEDPTGSGMFFLQPLRAEIKKGSDPMKEYPLERQTSNFPTGKVVFK